MITFNTLIILAAQPEPQNTRFNFGNRPSSSSSSNNANTRFFTGNGALDAGLAGAAAGFAGQYVANQVQHKFPRWIEFSTSHSIAVLCFYKPKGLYKGAKI